MTRVFADTSFYVAMLNKADTFHARANDFASAYIGETITTEYVVVELGNWLSRSSARSQYHTLIKELYADPYTIIVPAEHAILNSGVELYAQRSDKYWSLTDCISFVVMSRFGLQDALTTDHHFHQAGFNLLLM
ncbi:MAG TPA: PIN domain-containing protein [Candidatus Hydrogenedentes bacterium]|nr:PIN domain-containing protein [Candidatus Hydrogenedentota bacterium]